MTIKTEDANDKTKKTPLWRHALQILTYIILAVPASICLICIILLAELMILYVTLKWAYQKLKSLFFHH